MPRKPPRSPARLSWIAAAEAAPRIACLALAATLGGCASTPLTLRVVPVRLAGLEFLQLNGPRPAAVEAMRAGGFLCSPEAASEETVPCLGPGNAPVVLSFVDGLLDRVWTPIEPEDARADRRDVFDQLVSDRRPHFAFHEVNTTDAIAVARLVPGDGSQVEVRHFLESGLLETVHLAPLRPRAPRSVVAAR